MPQNIQSSLQILYGGKFLREKTFTGFVPIYESFLHKIWGCGIFLWHQWAIHESLLCKKKNLFC